jgi:CRISPR-associated protein Cmr6
MSTRRTSLQSVVFQNTSNASLWLDKFMEGQNVEGERHNNDEEPFKNQLISEMAKTTTPDIYKSFYARWKGSLNAVGTKFKNLKVEGRMIVGLGAESILETSISLHRTYGVPFIAGSALKGLAASYADKNLEDKNWRKEGGRAHEFVFGSQGLAGFVTFHDALLIPETQKPLHADIMTVHHSDYYGNKNVAPADWDSPIPIPFLSATGNYLVAISGVEGAEDWVNFVFVILEKALQEEGIGAKTSSGYGRATLSELPLSEEEKHAANANLLEESVNQLVAEIQGVQGSGKEAKDKLKAIATKHINKGNMSDDYKLKLAKAMCEKVEALQIDLSATEWFTRVKGRNQT